MKAVAKSSRLAVATVLGLILFLGLFVNAWIFLPNPKGWDTIHHLYLTQYVLEYWPNLDWNYQWAAGMPQFRWYPSAAPYFMAFLVKLFPLTVEFSLIVFVFLALAIMGVGSYSLMREVSGKSKASLVGVTLLLTSPCLWSLHVDAGLQPRLMSLAFAPLSWLFLVRYAKNGARKNFVATAVSSSLSLSFHTFYGLATLFSTLFMSLLLMEKGRKKVLTTTKIGAASILLAPLPFLSLLYSPMPRFSLATYEGSTVELLGLPSARNLLYLSPVLALFALSLPIIALSSKATFKDRIERRTLTSLGLLSVLITTFILLGFFVRGGSYYLWLPVGPGEAVAFLPVCLAPLCGILLSKIYVRIKKEFTVSTILCSLIILSFVLQVSIRISPTSAFNDFLSQHGDGSFKVYEELSFASDETMYRVGIYSKDGWLGQTFNYLSKTPQTRDYFSQGVLYPDWLWWLYEGVWNKTDNYPEKSFLLDWFAVKWVLVDKETSNPNIFLNKPQFKLVAKATTTPIYEFEYAAASQIVTAQTVPTMLVIGEYSNVLRGLSHSGFDSRSIIPIRGGDFIDDHTPEELSTYDAIFLYNYRYRNYEKAWNILREYVSNGGGLIVETGVQYACEWNSSSLPPIFPIDRTVWLTDISSWNFASSGNVFAVNFSSFSPAIYESKPWGISAASNESLRGWAESILWSNGRPVVAAGRYGAGRVIWSGMNLPWHLRIYENKEESRLLSKVIEWVADSSEKRGLETDFSVDRISPEKIVMRIGSACEGVLLKEFYFKDWHVYLEKDGKRVVELRILRAGPDFMYVPIPKEAEYPIFLVFEYDAFLERLTTTLSTLTLTLMLASLIPGKTRRNSSVAT